MRRFLATLLAFTLIFASSIPAFAGDSTSVNNKGNVTKPARAPGCAVLGTGSATGYTGQTPYPDEQSMRDGMGDSAKPATGGQSPVTDQNSPFYVDVTKDPGPQADRLKEMLKNDPDAFLTEYERVSGVSKEQVLADLKAERNPMVTVKPTADVRWPDGSTEYGVDTYDAMAKAFGISKEEAMASTAGGKSIPQAMNDLLKKYPEAAAGMGTSTNDSKNDGFGFVLGYLTGAAWVEGVGFVEYSGESLAKFAEIYGRGSEMYFNLLAALGIVPDDVDTLPPPPPPPKVLLEWKSKPKAYAEIKQSDYTIARNSEEWEAMAGIPHDETLYYDGGASNLSGHYIAEQVNNVSVGKPGISSEVVHGGPACVNGKCDATGCKHSSHPSCGQKHPSDKGGTWNHSHSTSSCENGGCTENYIHCEVTWKNYPGGITNYYKVKGYDTKEVDTLSQPVPYLENGSLSLSPAQVVQATSIVNSLPGGAWSVDSYSKTFKCVQQGCDDSRLDLQSWLNDHKVGGTPLARFKTDQLKLTDRDGTTYIPWKEFDIGIYVQSFKAPTSGCGTFEVEVAWSPISGGSSLSCSDGEMADYIGRFTSFHNWKKSNFLPGEEGWSEITKFDVCGYNGKWDTDDRRDCSTHKHLYYEDNLNFTDRIVNGEKDTPAGNVSFKPFSGSKSGSGAEATSTTITEYELGYGHPNDVVVHSPVAIPKYYISRNHYPNDQRTEEYANEEDMYLTPSLNFHVNRTVEWSKGVEIPDRGIHDTTTQKGNGYYNGRNTERWIEEVYYRFPFEVIYLGDSKRYSKNEWVSIPVDEYKSEFTLPLSEGEVPAAQYEAIVIAKNSPFRGDPQAAWDEEAERYLNYERDCGCQGDKEAAHGAKQWNTTDILGRIGNFTIDYTPDPNWSMFFSQKTIPEKWLVPNLVPEVNDKQFNKFLGPHHDIFDRMWWQVRDNAAEGLATERWPHGLDSYTSIPHYTKGHLGGILPAAPGKNLESVQDLLQFEPIKMGYPVWWSIETIGNYGTSVARLQVHPKFYLFDTKAATPGSQQVDIYAKVGSSYKRIHDSQNRTETDYKLNYSTKLTHNERRLGTVEKDLTKMVVGSGDYSDMFNPANVRWLGTPNEMIITKTLRTFFGTQTFESANHQPNVTDNGTPLSHAGQAQRWHGTILVPSSAKFTKPGEKDFIDTEGKYLMVVLEFTTLDANPWNIETAGSLSIGSNKEVYFPWFEYKTPDKDKDEPPTHVVNIPPDTVLVFDPNNPSLQDVQIHGTY